MEQHSRVLVTGGAGFLGSHLVHRLVREGHDVTVLDTLQTGRTKNFADIADKVNFIKGDVIEPFTAAPFKYIFHLACPASPPQYQADPVHTWKTSVIGTMNMLELAKKQGARVLFTSTSEVYGDPLQHPQVETYWGNVNPVGIRSCYDEGKRAAETACVDYARHHGVDVKIVRIFNTYGPRMHPCDGRVVSNFIVQALLGEKITLYGDGQQTRSFCFVDDLVEAIWRMMFFSDGFIGPVNIGNPDEFTVRELCDKVVATTGTTSLIEQLPLPKDDPARRKPNITLAEQKLKWRPAITLDQGLALTIDHFRKELADNPEFLRR